MRAQAGAGGGPPLCYGLLREGQGRGLEAVAVAPHPARSHKPVSQGKDVCHGPSHVMTDMGLSPASKRPAAVARR
jgi:hypothetical protein